MCETCIAYGGKNAKAKVRNAWERDRSAAQFKSSAHLMKRAVSLSEVARYHWLHGRETEEMHAGQAEQDQNTIWNQFSNIHSVFIINPRLKNTLSPKYTNHTPLERSSHVHQQYDINLS